MALAEIREMPTTIGFGTNEGRYHESIFRSHACLMQIREMAMKNADPSIILMVIDDVMDAPGVCRDIL